MFSDELAAPYGVAVGEGHVNVVNKYGLLRLVDLDHDGRADQTKILASGWGHTDDYHDWTVGLPQDEQGNYYVATACQQDDRSAAAAQWRGKVLKLAPEFTDGRERFRIEEISGGHRFSDGDSSIKQWCYLRHR